MAEIDYYTGMTEETELKLEKALVYVKMAIDNGDVAIQDSKPGEVRIIIRTPKKGKK